MKKNVLTIVVLFFYLFSFSQDKKPSRFSIQIGTEYRITPIYPDLTEYISKPGAYYNLDQQLSGTSVNYVLRYLSKKKFEIGFSQSFRYDHIYYKSSFSDVIPNTNYPYTEGESVNDWITDYHLIIGQYFKLFKKEFFVRGGISLMNRGTNYSVTYLYSIDDQGGHTYIVDQLNFTFFALNFNTGIAFDKFELGIGAYFIPGAGANFDDERNIILPFFKFSYRLR